MTRTTTYEKFLKDYQKVYPAPVKPRTRRVFELWTFDVSLAIGIANLLLSGLRTYEIFRRVSVLGFVDPIFAVVMIEATIGAGILTLGRRDVSLSEGPPKRSIWIAITWLAAITLAVLIAILTNGIHTIESLGVTFNQQALDFLSVIAMGVLVPLLGIAHFVPLLHDMRFTDYQNLAASEAYKEEYKVWIAQANQTYEVKAEADTTVGKQRNIRSRRREAIFNDLDRGEEFTIERIEEAAAFFGVTPATIKRDIQEYVPTGDGF